MYKCLFITFLSLIANYAHSQTCPRLSYNNQLYETVQIGSQCWMAENLDDSSHNIGNSIKNNESKSCFGRLYNFEAAIDEGIKINGWHLPSDAEWEIISNALGGAKYSGDKLKIGGGSGFNALFVGMQNLHGIDYSKGDYGDFWSCTPIGKASAWSRSIYRTDSAFGHYVNNRNFMFYVRLLKD